jgi:glycosyltransferase involved in cell wall biosynthesis
MISVILPALNEAGAVAKVIDAFHRTLQSSGVRDYEIIVVDDGSADGTGRVAAEAGAIVVRHPHNVGYGHSIKDGVRRAKYDTIVLSDADGTYPIDHLPELLAQYKEGFDLVIGQRMNTDDYDPLQKRVLRRIFRRFAQVIAGRRVPDVNSGLRVFDKALVTEHFPILSDAFSFTTSQTLSYMLGGRFVSFVAVPYHWREGQSKVRLLKDSFRTLQFVVRTVLYYQPMRIFILFSLLLIGLSILSLIASFVLKINAPYFIAIGGLLTALVVFCLGLLADLLHHILGRLHTG